MGLRSASAAEKWTSQPHDTIDHTMSDTKHITLRLPQSVATRLEERSRATDLSMNAILVEAARDYLGGEAPPDQRLAELETTLGRTMQAFADATEDVGGLKDRLERLERLARQSGADI